LRAMPRFPLAPGGRESIAHLCPMRHVPDSNIGKSRFRVRRERAWKRVGDVAGEPENAGNRQVCENIPKNAGDPSNMTRVKVPEDNQDQVLLLSRRRCCICFGLYRDLGVKRGQIAHLDHDNTNYDLDNLAFLCLPHHDEYDSKTSQSKGFRESEVKLFRRELYDLLASSATEPQAEGDETLAKAKRRRFTENAAKLEIPEKDVLYEFVLDGFQMRLSRANEVLSTYGHSSYGGEPLASIEGKTSFIKRTFIGHYEVNAEWKLFLEDWAGGYTASSLATSRASSPDAIRRSIQSKIAAFIKTGNDLRGEWTKRLGGAEQVQRQSAIAISGWHKSVEDYLTTIPRADVYVARFQSRLRPSGSYPMGINVNVGGNWDLLLTDLVRLNEFLVDPDLGKS